MTALTASPQTGEENVPHAAADETDKMERMDLWLDAVCDQFGVDPSVVTSDRDALLDLISTVAHGPSRPGAPMTAFVVGYVAASTGRPVADLTAEVSHLAETWA